MCERCYINSAASRSKRRRVGISLLEVCVVGVIVSTVLLLTVMWIPSARRNSRRNQCADHLRAFGEAAKSFVDSKKNFPPAADMNGYSFYVYLLPYIDMQETFDKINMKSYCYGAENLETYYSDIPLAKCPESPSEQLINFSAPGEKADLEYSPFGTHYAAVMGAKDKKSPPKPPPPPKGSKLAKPTPAAKLPPEKYPILMYNDRTGGMVTNGLMYLDSKVTPKSATDGLDKTFLFGETSWEDKGNRPWMAGSAWAGTWICSGRNIYYGLNEAGAAAWGVGCHDVSFGSRHKNGSNFCMGDGSVLFILQETDPRILQALASRNGGEPDLLDVAIGEEAK